MISQIFSMLTVFTVNSLLIVYKKKSHVWTWTDSFTVRRVVQAMIAW